MSLLDILKERPEDILLPNPSLQQDALRGLKESLDAVARKYSPLDAVHVDGLKADQVWVQAQMVLEGVTMKLNNEFSKYEGENAEEGSDNLLDSNSDSEEDIEDEDAENQDELGEDSDEENQSDMELDIENMHDDYEESDEEAEEADEEAEEKVSETNDKETNSSDEEGGEGAPNTEDNFDLAEFQQHVLQLEQENDDDDADENVDYFAEVEDPSDDADMHYEDFFGPAPKRAKPSTKKVKFSADDEEEASPIDDEVEHELDDAMETTRKDLFDDEEEDDGTEAGSSGENLSKFERQQLELSKQIEELENENVGQKEWGMRGEAQAKDRPEDSLYSIQFERNAKPVPVITVEATASIEDLIKERIKKEQFDDIPRRSEITTGNVKKDLPELSDAKSQKSLAELYEEDQMRKENPDYYANQDSAVLDAAHREVVDLFTSVTRKLDALCSWQYTPRAAAPSLTVLSDTQSISMEEAQPGTMAPEAQLAPQEVYKTESAMPMANQEMSTSLKRKKRRDKAKSKTGNKPNAEKSGKAKSKEEMFSTLKRGNVTMVDKRGNKRDMRGQEVNAKAPPSGAQVKL